MSSKSLREDLDTRLAFETQIRLFDEDSGGEFTPTMDQLEEELGKIGLELTTKDAVDWGTKYPGHADTAQRICELEQRIADLQQILDEERKRYAAE